MGKKLSLSEIMLDGWKPFLLKYGGIKAYRKALPLFLGLILGDFVVGSMWGIMGLISGEPTYTFKNW